MIIPQSVVGGLVGGLAEAAHVIDDCCAIVGAYDAGTGVLL